MIPGRGQIIACPICKGLAAHMTLVSGNTFGARVWTDGKQIAPMLPRPPAVVKCRHCSECFWLVDAEKVNSVDPWLDEEPPFNPDWAAAKTVKEPTEKQFYQAIEKGLATDPDQEKDLRILAWWRRNDAFRDNPPELGWRNPNGPGPWKRNLETLTNLLQEGDETECLMKAEVLRELGEFESAKEVLSRIHSTKLAEVIRQLHSLCEGGDMCVRELQFGH